MPLLKLANPQESPPGYFRYPRHPDRPLTTNPADFIWGGDLQDLIAKIHAFRVTNQLPLGDPESECQDWLCRVAGAVGRPANPAKRAPGVKASGAMVARFLSAMVAWGIKGGSVTQEEAERRASICAGCKFNVQIDDAALCLGCFGLAARVMQIIGDRRSKLDDSLQFCGACGCSLKVVPFVPLDILNRAHLNSDFTTDTGQTEADGAPIPCWRKAASEQ